MFFLYEIQITESFFFLECGGGDSQQDSFFFSHTSFRTNTEGVL